MATVLVLTFLTMAFPAFGQGGFQLQYGFTQERGGQGSSLDTATSTLGVTCLTTIDNFTSWSISLIAGNGNASVIGDNIEPIGQGAATSFSAGPVPINQLGTILRIRAWINPGWQPLSARTVSEIDVDGVRITPASVSANFMTPFSEFLWSNPTGMGIQKVDFKNSIWAVNSPAETGMSIEVLSVPEPSSVAIVGLGLAWLLVLRRRN